VVRYIRKIVIPETVEPILSPRDGSCHHETFSNSMILNNMALEYITQWDRADGRLRQQSYPEVGRTPLLLVFFDSAR
jgi:hypothetical protein